MAIDVKVQRATVQDDGATKQKTKSSPPPWESIADLKSDLAYLRRQVHGLRSRLHGELAVLALRMEENERRAMKRRKVSRRWMMAAVAAVWLAMVPIAVHALLGGPILLPALFLVATTVIVGVTIALLNLHNDADEQEHADRHRNWFRFTTPDEA